MIGGMSGLEQQGYESAEELAKALRINSRSLRRLIRRDGLVPDHKVADGSRYRITSEVALRIAKNSHVMALPKHGP